MVPDFQLHDPRRDLSFERLVDLPREKIWAAWTQPELLLPWFCPRPWSTVSCEIDLRPGGIFRTVMRSPEGQEFPNLGCYLEVVPNEKLVWTNALGPGFRPVTAASLTTAESFFFTACLSLSPQGTQTKYVARVKHGSTEDCGKHAGLGFQEGWGVALDQLIAFMKNR